MFRSRHLLCAGLAAVALAGCAGATHKAYEPLPATTTIAATAPSTTPVSLPAGCAGQAGTRTEVPYATVDEVDPKLLSVDVYQLATQCGTRPVVFWVHGGEWSDGDKRTKVAPLAGMAAAHGWVLVSVNYRLSTQGSNVHWPDPGTDVATAIAFVLANAKEYDIDTSRVAVMGYEAGGHLATMVAVDPSLLAAAGTSRDDIGCLVALDPEGLSIAALIDQADEKTINLVENAFGTEFETYQSASPNVVLTQVTGRVPDALVVTRGPVDRQAPAYDFADLARATGASVNVVLAAPYDAQQVVAAIGDATDTVVNAPVVAFLDRCLA